MMWPWVWRGALTDAQHRARRLARRARRYRRERDALAGQLAALAARPSVLGPTPARIELAPPDVEQRVRAELSDATTARLTADLLARAQVQQISLTEEEAREHAVWMVHYAEMSDSPPL